MFMILAIMCLILMLKESEKMYVLDTIIYYNIKVFLVRESHLFTTLRQVHGPNIIQH
jgi:hypothetical protein